MPDIIYISKKGMKKKRRIVFYSILAFFLIFAFPIIPMVSSAKLVMLFVLFQIFYFKDFKERIAMFAYRFRTFPQIYYLLFFYTIAVTVIACAIEMSLASKVFSSFFLYIISFFFFTEASKYLDVTKVVVYCFLAQSFIIILAIFSESFFSLTAPFRAAVNDNHELAYGRLRGNAICGYQFFGIATMFTFIIIYLILHLKDFKYGILLLLPICFAAICSGRFSIVGIFIGVAMLMVRDVVNGKLRNVIWVCVIGTSLLLGAIALLYNNVDKIEDPLMHKVVQHYLIDPIDSVLFQDSFQSSSTDRLLEMYGQDEIKQYFWLGAGRYTNPDGHYFGGVDIGYYRMLGYYGIMGFLLITYALYYLIYCTRSDLDIYTKHAFFINFLVLNFKGDVQVFNNNMIPIVVAFLFFSSKEKLLFKIYG